MWAEFLQTDARGQTVTHADPGGFACVHVAGVTLTKTELENAIIFPHDDRVLVVDGFDEPCPYPEGPVFVWLTIEQHRQAKELIDA
jgi:hypothetical protein